MGVDTTAGTRRVTPRTAARVTPALELWGPGQILTVCSVMLVAEVEVHLTMQSRRFVVDLGEDEDGYWYSVDGGELRGPFVLLADRDRDLRDLIARARRRAEDAGGSLRLATGGSWVVTVPDGAEIEGGEAVSSRRAA